MSCVGGVVVNAETSLGTDIGIVFLALGQGLVARFGADGAVFESQMRDIQYIAGE